MVDGAPDLTPRAHRELEFLAQIRGPGQAEAILIIHQRHRGGCLCGWAELGKSFAGHQAAALREAGLLVEEASPPGPPPPRRRGHCTCPLNARTCPWHGASTLGRRS